MIDAQRLEEWLGDGDRWINPPGCIDDILRSPTGDDTAFTVGLVQEHRFAFYYWVLFASAQESGNPKPILITVDAHYDVGTVSNVHNIQDDLDQLQTNNRLHLGLFSWLRLHSLNDGHMLPALYLDFFSDVFVLLNTETQPQVNDLLNYEDKYGHKHDVKHYKDSDKLLKEIPVALPIYLDIDLDYFTTPDSRNGNRGSEELMSVDFIRLFLSLKGYFMNSILNRLVGMTVALEPKYCGGLMNSTKVLEILNKELFAGTLLKDSCRWNR